MQSLRQCVRQLALFGKSTVNRTNVLPDITKTLNFIPICSFHISSIQNKKSGFDGPKHFLEYNDTIFPPQKPDEERRPAVS
jgi:hypothetical protein